MVKVSIVIPVHNTACFLETCIASVTAQTLTDIEIILVENGSTDDSLTVCHRMADADHRIKVIHMDVADLSAARNEGAKAAQGEYIGFVDSDDTILPTMYEDMYCLARSYGLDLVNSGFYCRYDHKSHWYPYPSDGKVTILNAKEAVSLNLREKISRLACTMLYHRSLFEKIQFPTGMYYEDRASTFLFMAASRKVGVINKPYYAYYQRCSSINQTKDFRKYRDYAEADCRRLRFINESGMFCTRREKARIAFKSANAFVRTLGHMTRLAVTDEEKNEIMRLRQMASLIPKGTILALKQHMILKYIDLWLSF